MHQNSLFVYIPNKVRKSYGVYVGFKILTPLTKSTFFWVVMPCRSEETRRFRGKHLLVQRHVALNPENHTLNYVYLLYCHIVCVTIDGVWIGDWIY
jgi:hypothetical protein